MDLSRNFILENHKIDSDSQNIPNFIKGDFSTVIDFSKNDIGIVDVGYDKQHFETFKKVLDQDISSQSIRKLFKKLGEKYGNAIIDEETMARIEAYQEGEASYDDIPRPNKQRILLGKRIDIENNILHDLLHDKTKKQCEIAKSNCVTKSKVSEVWKEFVLTGQIPALKSKLKRDLILPAKNEIITYFEERWIDRGRIADDWEELTNAMKNKFPKLKDFANKTIMNKTRILTGVRSISDKKMPFKLSHFSFIEKQLSLCNILAKMHMQEEKIIYFDQSSIQLTSFKSKSLGTTDMRPHRYTPVFNESIHFLMGMTINGFIAVQFSNYSARSEDVKNFITAMMKELMKSIDKNKADGWYILMDNAGYQKTSQIKELCKKYPLHIIYSIPTSPFINLIEDVFLGVKRYFRENYYSSALSATPMDLLIKGIRTTYKKGIDWIMRKHISIVMQKINKYQKHKK
jgi:transposase